jgi:serine/threonine-protein kinase HipA
VPASPAHCAICLAELALPFTAPPTDALALAYHPRCIRELFGTPTLPRLDLDTGEVMAAATAMAGKMSISGFQQKISMALTTDHSALVSAPAGGRFILKPQITTPLVPENEHVTMRMAKRAGVGIPPCGMVRLRDGALAYIVARFDRLEDGSKLHLEDFCQLAELPPSQKYRQTADLWVRLLRQYATEPTVAVYALFRYLVFSYCVANGDLHLKNLSLLRQPDGTRVLAPAYDLVNTQLAIGDQKFAMLVGGADGPIRRSRWEQLAAYARIPPKAANLALGTQVRALEPMVALIRASFLPPEAQVKYERMVRERTGLIGPAGPDDEESPATP